MNDIDGIGDHARRMVAEAKSRHAFLESQPTYQRYDAMYFVRGAARLLKREGDMVIYRDAFRWHDDADGRVLSNHYEMQSVDYLAQEFGYAIIHDFRHVAVVRPK